ncbi:MAG: threonine/serine exporter family protein [Microbacterium sp.]
MPTACAHCTSTSPTTRSRRPAARATGIPLGEAELRCRDIRRTPFRYRPTVIIAAQALLAVGVAIMFGVNLLNMSLAFLAAALAALTQYLLARARVPYFFSQVAGGLVLTIVAALTPLLLSGAVTLAGAATVGVALAVGASLGIYLGQPLRATLNGVTRARTRLRA